MVVRQTGRAPLRCTKCSSPVPPINGQLPIAVLTLLRGFNDYRTLGIVLFIPGMGQQGRVANPRPVATIKKWATGRVMQQQVLTRTVGHGETGFLLRSIASSKVFSANKMADITEGVRVQIDNGSVLICVGRDDQNFYFQDENGNKIVYST